MEWRNTDCLHIEAHKAHDIDQHKLTLWNNKTFIDLRGKIFCDGLTFLPNLTKKYQWIYNVQFRHTAITTKETILPYCKTRTRNNTECPTTVPCEGNAGTYTHCSLRQNRDLFLKANFLFRPPVAMDMLITNTVKYIHSREEIKETFKIFHVPCSKTSHCTRIYVITCNIYVYIYMCVCVRIYIYINIYIYI